VGSCRRVLRVPFNCVPRFFWEGKLGVLVRNFRTVKVVYWVTVSHGSGVGSPWLCVKVDYNLDC